MTKRRFSLISLSIVAISFFIVGTIITSSFDFSSSCHAIFGGKKNEKAKTEQISQAIDTNTFVRIAAKEKPAVVNISTTKTVKGSRFSRFHEFGDSFGNKSPFEDFFGDDFFRRFFGDIPQKEFKEKSLGSGLIISQDGYILTNNHVIENADDIKVKLSDEEVYEAKIIGKDSKTDLALIKIEAKNDLPIAILGDSDELQVGEWVMAIGNPFGLNQTVTVGVVSAKGRVIGSGPYDDFIQTDASINPGNSGGPLINTKGEVIGINTAIIASGEGIGFAIPINMAKDIFDDLKEKGRVVRGWLGVTIQKITPELAKSFKLKTKEGALVASVIKDDPADKAGIKQGDVIIELDGKEIKTSRELVNKVASIKVGKKIKVKLIRDGKKIKVTVKVGERPDEEKTVLREEIEKQLGMSVQNLTPELAKQFGLEKTEGVLVSDVEVGSVADEGGVRRGDIIIEVNRKKITNVEDYKESLGQVKGEETILFLLRRGKRTLFIALKAEK